MFFSRRKQNAVEQLCDYIWSSSVDFIVKNKLKNTNYMLVCMWTATFYSIQDIIQAHNIFDEMQSYFARSAAQRFNVNYNDLFAHSVIEIQNDMLKILGEPFQKNKMNEEARDLLEFALWIGDPDSNSSMGSHSIDALLLSDYIFELTSVMTTAVMLFPNR